MMNRGFKLKYPSALYWRNIWFFSDVQLLNSEQSTLYEGA